MLSEYEQRRNLSAALQYYLQYYCTIVLMMIITQIWLGGCRDTVTGFFFLSFFFFHYIFWTKGEESPSRGVPL